MKKLFFFCSLSMICLAAFAQTDSATYLLHKFAQHIGKETYHRSRNGQQITYDVDFKFTDRGNAVPLNAQLIVTNTMEPVSLYLKGSTSRFSTINDTVRFNGNMVQLVVDDSAYTQPKKPLSFPVGGYSPGTVQMALLQYWKSHGRPKTISLLPTGEVQIRKDGMDTLVQNGKKIILERFVVSGLVWGNELVWTDTQTNLVCLITNDAEGDKLEMMLEPYESLLPEMIAKAADYGMRLFTSAVGKVAGKSNPIVIVGGNILDVAKKEYIKNSSVLVDGGMIKKIGPAGSFSIPAGATVIHAEGKTILPGLWDMHAHFEQAEWGPAYLAAGVTTVRDCGNEFVYINAIQQAIDNGKGIGPHILKAGIIDGPGAMGLGIVRATTPEEAIKAVNMYKDNGFVQIKIYSSVKPAILKVICDEAHRLGLSVTGHIPMNMNIRQGVDSGMNQVNHLQYVYSSMKKNKDRSVNLEDSVSVKLLDFLKEHNVVIDPTMGVFEMIFKSVKEDITVMEPAFYTLPLPLQTLFKNTGSPDSEAIALKPIMNGFFNTIKALHDKGITIIAGTDMGFPGYSLDRELELYVTAGLSPAEAIQTATIVPAQVMKIENKYGSVEVGKMADLVIINGDPLRNIREIRKVQTVIKDGKVYDPVALHKMAGFKQ